MDEWGTTEDVGLRVAALRKARGWNYRELSDWTALRGERIAVPTLHVLENGDKRGHRPKLTIENLITLARVFEIEPGDLLTSSEALANREAAQLLREYRQAHRAAFHALRRVFCAHLAIRRTRSDDVYSYVSSHTEQGEFHVPDFEFEGVALPRLTTLWRQAVERAVVTADAWDGAEWENAEAEDIVDEWWSPDVSDEDAVELRDDPAFKKQFERNTAQAKATFWQENDR